ncbi:hypothetical protein C7S16_6765 [Burkholderia thailandensis]|uniref:Uncharacterized protein n=1 Tax=Burkholderia thailandensis TaxID=57975 RepID=A0AAW9CWJ9_BURTH|nr:hypothetical protein [Burkholderia thailandensis]
MVDLGFDPLVVIYIRRFLETEVAIESRSDYFESNLSCGI